MESLTVILTFACCATVHIVLCEVMALFARHRVKYLSIAWILGIFAVILAAVAFFGKNVAAGAPGILHPAMMLMLVVGAFFQSIYTFGVSLPGYLEWRRMFLYASPIFVLTFFYVLGLNVFGSLKIVNSFSELFAGIWSLDLILRLLAFCLGIYYVANIVLLPRCKSKSTNLPAYLIWYCTVLGLSDLFYIYVAIDYTPAKLCVYMVIFTLLNSYLVYRSLDDLAFLIPYPNIDIKEAPEMEEKIVDAEKEAKRKEDFNAMNQARYHRVQFWMQNHKEEWTDNTFNRDRLCEATGINRQLMLQCLRSQGHNNIHDYLTVYRVEEFKRLAKSGKIQTIADCDMAGFGTPKTARSCFERLEGYSLDRYLESIQQEVEEEKK